MVVFTCNHCGESLQKPKVEKHYQFVCRTTKLLTCVDCLKDFKGEEFAAHTKCLTEDQRYGAKGSLSNSIVTKGEAKQESWLESIHAIMNSEPNLKPSIRNLLNIISNFANVPRKKPKFINFITNSMGRRANLQDIEEVWEVIEKHSTKQKKDSTSPRQEKEETADDKGKIVKSKKEINPEDTVLEDVNGGVTDGTDSSIKKKKKRKNKELSENDSKMNIEMEESEISGNVDNSVDVTKKKKRKSKVSETDEVINGETLSDKKHKNSDNKNFQNAGSDTNCNVEANNDLPSKKKKRKRDQVITAEGNVCDSLPNENGKDIQKKKKLTIENKNTTADKQAQSVTEEDMQNDTDIYQKDSLSFDLTAKILEFLEGKSSISLCKLQKKVLKSFLKHTGKTEASDKFLKKFNKKLKKIEGVEINDDVVIISKY